MQFTDVCTPSPPIPTSSHLRQVVREGPLVVLHEEDVGAPAGEVVGDEGGHHGGGTSDRITDVTTMYSGCGMDVGASC